MKLGHHALFSLVGGLIKLSLNILSIPVLVTGLGIERYGVWVALIAVANLSLVLRPGWNEGLTYYLAHVQTDQERHQAGSYVRTTLTFVLIWGCVVAAILLMTAPLVAEALFGDHATITSVELASLVQLLAPLVLARMFQQWGIAALAGLLRYETLASIETIVNVVHTLGLILLSLGGAALGSLIIWTALPSAVASIAYLILVRRSVGGPSPLFGIDLGAAQRLTSYGIVSWVITVGGVFFSQGDRVLVSAFLDPATTGVYGVITSIAAKVNEIIAPPLQTLVPAISSAHARGNRDQLISMVRRAYRYNGTTVWILASGIMLFARPITEVLIQEPNSSHVAALLIMTTFIYALYCLNGPANYVGMGLDKMQINAVSVLAGSVLSLALMAALIPSLGIVGALIGNVGFQLTWAMTLYVTNDLGLSMRWLVKETARVIGATGAMTTVALLILAVPQYFPASLALALALLVVMTLAVSAEEARLLFTVVRATWRQLTQKDSRKMA
jgi:O-antigen/teichoic acid export membrane protein